MTESLRVIRLTAENVKRIRAVDIVPDSNMVVVSGRNAQGKSSVLDSIWLALGGGDATKDTPSPVREGQDHASVTVDLGRFTVTRTWKNGKTTLKVTSADGAQYKSPQTMLDELIGDLSFDPLSFANASARDQRTRLLSVVDLPFNLDDLDTERANVFAIRTDANRSVKELQAVFDSLPVPPPDTPDTEVSASKIVDQLTAASDLQAETRRAYATRDLTLERLTAAQDALAAAQDAHNAAIKAVETLPPVEDVNYLREQLTAVEATNQAVREKKERDDTRRRLDAAIAATAGHNARIAAIETQKAQALTDATMPIGGLGFDDDGVTYNGVPLAQVSGAERLRVSVAMAMALNPTIRVIRITDGSLLDSDNMDVIARLAAAQDFQVWIERVDESGEVGIVIEDGAVA